jgi:pimeloyl-ACP methyl ester carboxylesterase
MTTEELLRAGIAAAKAGDLAGASKLLIQVVQADPNSELGWLWLGFCRTASEQREYCFHRVLAINPQNPEARRQLEVLQRLTAGSQEIKPAPAPNSPPPAVVQPRKDRPFSQTVNTPPPAKKVIHPKPRKKNNSLWIWVGGITFGLLVCASVAGILIFARILNLKNTFVQVNTIPTAIPVTPTPAYTAIFEPAACPFTKPDPAQVECGYVIVPEDRSGNLSDTIRLAVAIYHSPNAAPKPDPILYLPGGPGDEALSWSVSTYEEVLTPLLVERDFIVFDPRGVGRSKPALDCDEFGQTYLQDLQGKIPAAQRASYYEGALLACKNNLIQQGANLSAYTSVDMAADAKDVVVALGYQQANLYGISYGTRVAQFVMRNHPEVVRSAVLDSVVPVEAQMLNQSSNGDEAILRVLFEDCKTDPVCSTAYPELETVYRQVFDQLNAKPVPVTVPVATGETLMETVNGYTFRNAVLWALRTPYTIPLTPQLIYRVRDGDYSALTLSMSFPVLAFDSISLGSYISVNCHDQVFAMDMETLDTTIRDMCKLWDIKPPAPGENDPVNSEIPTLIFAGSYDPATPPALARQLSGHLPHSYVAEIPNQGHAPSATGMSDCPTRLIVAFLQAPNLAPDMTCIQEIEEIKFVVPYDASTPLVLEPVRIDQYQLDSRVPAGWEKVNFGFYNRNGFWGDATQIGIQRTEVSETEWLTWLSTNFSSTQGLDQPAVKKEERQANGLKWSIYQTTSKGTLIDIAFASSGKQTFMVLLASYPNERDALYNTVFLPIVDATVPAK